ncbi:Cyclic di-GMP phosphodiesterase response regulator RpfG [Tepidimonas thermarum]|uniref:Cyclic di-GMP phosphodiesterase response regulator RpfG n=1 Tax=Tepidimonas thermarum TaxID=335431 RepID=A0A554WWL9_9BURK|nr:Cyclic di-GMP phosphodiesterase response regulator RpfG [Tepidimonas thermarum]
MHDIGKVGIPDRILLKPGPLTPEEFEIMKTHTTLGYQAIVRAEAIPPSARLMAVADVYDALISRRVYKPPFTHEEACQVIAQGRGQHFDPDVADAFADIHATFRAIAQQFQDEAPPPYERLASAATDGSV